MRRLVLRRWQGFILAVLLALPSLCQFAVVSNARASTASAQLLSATIANDALNRTWSRTDQPVAANQVSRTWMWGPQPNTSPMVEPYWDSATGWRLVQYFDKSRMEITHPEGDQSSVWYVTNGLLAKELITGNMQLGDNMFDQYAPAQVNAAGDPNDPNGPTYASFTPLLGSVALVNGSPITQTLSRTGEVGNDPSTSQYAVTAIDVAAPTNHTVASVFWSFMNSAGLIDDNGQTVTDALFLNPFYATGYPLTEAYWTNVLVGGVSKQVLVQVFERRVLTYTPSNPDGWKVEAGNVGQHYYTWRYGQLHQPPLVRTDLASLGWSRNECWQQWEVATSQDPAANTFYGQQVTTDYTGSDCLFFQSQTGAWWDIVSGVVTVHQGSYTGSVIDRRPFSVFSILVDPTDHQYGFRGFPSANAGKMSCAVQAYYRHWTTSGMAEWEAYIDGTNWNYSSVVFTDPPQRFSSSTPCVASTS